MYEKDVELHWFYKHLWSVVCKLGLAGLVAWAGLAGWLVEHAKKNTLSLQSGALLRPKW